MVTGSHEPSSVWQPVMDRAYWTTLKSLGAMVEYWYWTCPNHKCIMISLAQMNIYVDQEHCSNISGDILDYVLYCLSETTYDVITFLICIIEKQIFVKWTKVFQKGKCHSSLLWKAFQIRRNYFLLHRHFNSSQHTWKNLLNLAWLNRILYF